jgi:hypothetical protein
MSHFAKVVNGIVANVIVAEQSFIDSGAVGDPSLWVQCSYNTKFGIHHGPDGKPDGGVALRGNFPGVGHIYNEENDVFHHPSPLPSFVLNETTWHWEPPIPSPDIVEGGPPFYRWCEVFKTWYPAVRNQLDTGWEEPNFPPFHKDFPDQQYYWNASINQWLPEGYTIDMNTKNLIANNAPVGSIAPAVNRLNMDLLIPPSGYITPPSTT